MSQLRCRMLGLLLSLLPMSVAAQPPTLVGEVVDGTPHDIVAGDGVLYLAQGRHVATLDPDTSDRIGNLTDAPYSEQLVAVEYDQARRLVVVATERKLHVHDLADGSVRTWAVPVTAKVDDIELIPSDRKVVLVVERNLYIVDYAGALTTTATAEAPSGISFFRRVHVAQTRDGWMAYMTGAMTAYLARGLYGLVIARLDSPSGYANPTILPTYWNPVTHYGSFAASVLGVHVVENFGGTSTLALVACATVGQLSVLDVTNPGAPGFVLRRDVAPGLPVFKVVGDPGGERVYVASENVLHVLSLATGATLGQLNVGFYDAGDRDVALVVDGMDTTVWSATHQGVGYVLNAVDVGTPTPQLRTRRWWISSSDGAVVIPEWHSLYLPTFGGLVRYDISDPTSPIPVDASYRPANGIIEHIESYIPDPDNPGQRRLLTATGAGGIQVWPISSAQPNHDAPTTLSWRPPQWGNDPVYQNHVGIYRRDGVDYYLMDLSNQATNENALIVHDTSTGQWRAAIEQSPQLRSLTKTVRVHGDHAFVTSVGGFFVVDLSQLPAALPITDLVINDWNNDGTPDETASLVVADDGRHIYVAHRPGVVQSYAFDAATGTVGGRLDMLTGAAISGATSPGGSYAAALRRAYFPGDDGRIMEIDVSDPADLQLRSSWSNGSYFGEMQDSRVFMLDGRAHLLAVKNNEAFAILALDEPAVFADGFE